jgi:hypothetical protein
MGKRELLIVAAFVLIGAVAYHLTAPPPRPGETRFSLSGLTDAWRRRAGGNRPQATNVTSGTIPITAALSEISVTGASAVTVTGESRSDIGFSLLVQSSGADDAAAREAADSVSLAHDDMGRVMVLDVRAPRDARPSSTLTLHVPATVSVRLDGARRTSVAGVAALRLNNLSGETDIRNIAGAIEGGHRNGTLGIDGAGAVDLSLVGSNATIAGARGAVTITARNGETHFRNVRGALDVDASNALVDIDGAASPLRVNAVNGTVAIAHAHADIRLDARVVKTTLVLDAAVPVTAIVVEGTTRLELVGPPPITIDAATDHGTIDASELGLAPEIVGATAALRHTFGTAARVSVRCDRGQIVIALGK